MTLVVPADIPDEENLGRIVVSKGQAKYARNNNRNQINAFLEKEGEKAISVDRIDIAPSQDVLVANGEKVAAARKRPDGSKRTFYGWAVIIAEKARDNMRKVVSSPQKDNPYHADIILPDLAVRDREEQKGHAQELADNSTWRERPQP